MPAGEEQKSLQTGLANSSIGQVQVHLKRDAQAVDPLKAAAPFLKPYDFYYARNQYFLGLAYVHLKKTPDARAALNEVVALNTPFKSYAQDEITKLPTTPAAKAKKRG
ncbi:MAG: hypothetical protein HY046_02480 [Acidobacteria bacterium]|nr:hypothetical protein [Acidobacteriota bacterium]